MDPARAGWNFLGWMCGDTDVTGETTYADLAKDDAVARITLTAQWADIEKPSGKITVDKSEWREFLNNITFGLFFKETQKVTITAEDNSGETVKIEYLLSEKALAEAELAGQSFTEYTKAFHISPDQECIICGRLTDAAQNIRYICSQGIVLDKTAPVISGVEADGIYCEAQTVTIREKYLGTVTVNGVQIDLDKNGQFVLSPDKKAQEIVVTDEAGNETKLTVTIHDGHTAAQDDGDCTTPVRCIYHSEVVMIPAKAHDFTGAWQEDETGHWHICQNSGCTVTDTKTAHSGQDDGDCTTPVNCDACGREITAASLTHTWGAWTADGEGTHTRRCKAEGCTAGAETENCHGGKASCTERAVCAVCGEKYGDIAPDNHTDLAHTPAAAATKEADGNSEYWRCAGCGRYYADAAATMEITEADTVIKRLPADEPSFPKTGDAGNLLPVAALLLLSGGAIAVTAAKKKRSVK